MQPQTGEPVTRKDSHALVPKILLVLLLVLFWKLPRRLLLHRVHHSWLLHLLAWLVVLPERIRRAAERIHRAAERILAAAEHPSKSRYSCWKDIRDLASEPFCLVEEVAIADIAERIPPALRGEPVLQRVEVLANSIAETRESIAESRESGSQSGCAPAETAAETAATTSTTTSTTESVGKLFERRQFLAESCGLSERRNHSAQLSEFPAAPKSSPESFQHAADFLEHAEFPRQAADPPEPFKERSDPANKSRRSWLIILVRRWCRPDYMSRPPYKGHGADDSCHQPAIPSASLTLIGPDWLGGNAENIHYSALDT